jgi:outer membrane protein assembly factor BamB
MDKMTRQTEPSNPDPKAESRHTDANSPVQVSENSEIQQRPRIYWWLPALILLAAGIALLVIWADPNRMRQMKHLLSLATGLLAGFTLGLWFMFFAPITIAKRWSAFTIVLAMIIAIISSVRIDGSTGDLVPIPSWRWSAKHDQLLDTPVTGQNIRPDTDLVGLADYPQFLGPNRDGMLSGPLLDRDWTAHQPKELWRIKVGDGWSAFAISGIRAVTQEQRGEDEYIVCYDIRTGSILWSHADRARFTDREALGGLGPRTTPTLTDAHVYCIGATGILNCLNLKTGEKIWATNILKDAGRSNPNEYGMAGSPLIIDDHLIVSAGGSNNKSLLAYNRATGQIVWSGGTDMASYSSPFVTTLAGQKQIVIFNKASVAGHDPKTGRLLWTTPWDDGAPKAAQPLSIAPDKLFVTSSYAVGCAMYQLSAVNPPKATAESQGDKTPSPTLQIKQLWKNLRMKSKFSNMVHRDGYIYGLDDGILTCLDVAKGRRQWKGGRLGHGQIILVDDLLLIQSEYGDVVLVEATPDDFVEVSRLKVLSNKTWNHAALAGRYLLVRNNREAACYQLPLREAAKEKSVRGTPKENTAKQ